MTVIELNNAIHFLDFCAFYYTVQLVRCALVSFVVFAVVILLRKTALKNSVFLKGAMWALFIPVLFAGKMKFFDETGIGMVFSNGWRAIGKYHVWICWLYICGIFLYAALLIRKKRKLKKPVAGMEKREINGTCIYIADIPVTPFTIGIFRPRIIMPKIMLEEYDFEEIQTILLHEKIHIRLGHLLFYFLWDILRVLLWLNPLLTICTKYFREDMEEICDWVTIRKSTGEAYSYGQMLLKSMRILQTESEGFNMFPAFVSDNEYRNILQRIKRIAGYKPYKQIAAIGTLIAVIFCVIGAVYAAKSISYEKNIEIEGPTLIYGYENGNVTFVDYGDKLDQIIFYDDSYVYVDREAFDNFLNEKNAKGEIYIVFGGFQKLPGVGGFGYSCQYVNDTDEEIVQLPYYNYKDDWMMRLYRIL